MAVDFAFSRHAADLGYLAARESHVRAEDEDVEDSTVFSGSNIQASRQPTLASAASGMIEEVFGIARDALTRMSVVSHIDEEELVLAAQQEFFSMKAPKAKKKSRQVRMCGPRVACMADAAYAA